MSPLTLTLKSLRNRKFTVSLTVISLALGVALLLGVERMRVEAKTGFTNTISGTDLIVGARTGQVSLLLSSVFRIGNPSQNISWETYQKIADNPRVAWTIPISLGDSHRGYRVVGTSTDYFEHYRYADKRPLEMAAGGEFSGTSDAVLGAEVAGKFGYGLGDEIVVAHGAGNVSFVEHADRPFRVAGILEPTGTPVDRAVHVSLAGIEWMHQGWDCDGNDHTGCDHGHGDHEECDHADGEHAGEGGAGGMERLAEIEAMLAGEEPNHLQPTQITAFLVGMHSRPDAVFLQRAINTYEGEALSAVMPGLALQELWQVVGVVEKTLLVISVFVVAVSLAGMLSALMTSLNERRREMAILRSVGARPGHIIALVAGEAFLTTALAVVVGTAFLYAIIAVARPLVLAKAGLQIGFSVLSSGEWILLGTVLAIGLLVGLIPAWRCYLSSLSDGLTIRT
jgi:putative ABC transport system permease protein